MSAYFYSGQIRRFLQQFIRLLNNFEIALGQNRTGISSLMRVPVYYGDSSRQVAAILAKNSENSLPSVPAMAVYIQALRYDRPRIQEPQFVSKMQIRERAYDPITGEYTSYQGDLLTVERLMPVPYLLTLKVDIWTTNTDQKLQLLEQIGVLFNPALELQSTDSYVDWTSLTNVELTDIAWTSRSVPIGTEDPIDVATLTFELPIWLSAPAKVKKMGVIREVIADIYEANGTIDHENGVFTTAANLQIGRRIYTPTNLNVIYQGNTLKLYYSDNSIIFNDGAVPNMQPGNWEIAVRSFGELSSAPANVSLLVNGISRVRLENDGITVIGTVAYHPVDTSLLLFTPLIDTLPVNTLPAVRSIIDPLTVRPDSVMANPTAGTRYLIVNPIGTTIHSDGNLATAEGPILWFRSGYPELVANANDIIEYNGNNWVVAFDSVTQTNVQYVTNTTNSVQYRWKSGQWTRSVEGRYGVGSWSFEP